MEKIKIINSGCRQTNYDSTWQRSRLAAYKNTFDKWIQVLKILLSIFLIKGLGTKLYRAIYNDTNYKYSCTYYFASHVNDFVNYVDFELYLTRIVLDINMNSHLFR